jgi:hypothetical protein
MESLWILKRFVSVRTQKFRPRCNPFGRMVCRLSLSPCSWLYINRFVKASTRPPAPDRPHGCSVVKRPSISRKLQVLLTSRITNSTGSHDSSLSWNPGNYLFQSEDISLLNVMTFVARVGRDKLYSIGWPSRERDDGE